ncbi:MAG: cap protein [Bacteroidetes bacterium]|nr:cap protein [Bacteroidota bacterium]
MSVLALSVAAVRTDDVIHLDARSFDDARTPWRVATLRLLAVGDVNLGRGVGQEILAGDTLYPFAAVRDSFASYDVVFANLESQLSDQDGETQHPRNNLIFTGPPGGAHTLRQAGVTMVSTANNHAIDYGIKALLETGRYLREAGVYFTGTSGDASRLFDPVIVSRNGLRIAFFACTDVMNIEDPFWKKYVAEADSAKLLPMIRSVRDSVDFIVVSYHGGEEYADRPTQRTKDFARQMIAGGADLFLGHHPHVPYGVEEFEGKYIIHSLGNFVFRQPDRYWTQRSFAFAATIVKDANGTRVSTFRCLPVRAGFQPEFVTQQPEIDVILERIKALSTHSLAPQVF